MVRTTNFVSFLNIGTKLDKVPETAAAVFTAGSLFPAQ